MLVISRKAEEGIIIGDNIKITVVEINRDRVRLGIDAPQNVKIVRNELYDTEKLNIQAAFNKMPADIMKKLMSEKENIGNAKEQ
jgi:carbon storage regulator